MLKMSHGIFNVVVTGFGPFDVFKVNPSWEVAKELTKLGLESKGICLNIVEIPVSYSVVAKEVPRLWEECAPQLVIHLGVAGSCREIQLETIAHRYGYCKPDVEGNCPLGGSCNGRCDVLCSQLDLSKAIEKVRGMENMDVCMKISADAGRYVCEFTYYTSLNVNCYRTVFIHVPPINKPYSTRQMAVCIKYIILSLLEQIENSQHNFKTTM